MASKMSPSRLRDQVYGIWIARPPERRRYDDTVPFVDDLWDSGIKLASSPSLHYQHVMDVIRTNITN